jgi:hypothetical protein
VKQEPNWPPPEWGTPEPGWDVPANVGRVDTEPDESAPVAPIDPPRPRPQRWCAVHRRGYRSPSYHERCSVDIPDTPPRRSVPSHAANCWSCRMNYEEAHYHSPQSGVVEHQREYHEIVELQNRIRRLERWIDRLEGRLSVDDVSDGPWSMDEKQWPVVPPPAYYVRGHH